MNKVYIAFVVFFLLMFSGCAFISLLNIGVGQEAIEEYQFPMFTKNEIRQSIKCVFEKTPQYKVPNTIDSNFFIHSYSSPGTPEFNRWNADSINFYFYNIIETDTLILWTRFSGLMDNWNNPKTEFGLTGILVIYGVSFNELEWKQKGDKDFSRLEKKRTINLFETEILPKIKFYLSKPCN